MAGGDLSETEFTRQRGHTLLVVVIAVGVHQHDGNGGDAVGLGAQKLIAHAIEDERTLDRAVGAHPLVDLDDTLVEHVRLDDVLGKNLRPRLVADAQRVAKPLSDEQQRALALALQERIGGDRGAHLHRADPLARDSRAGRNPEEPANALDSGVPIGFRVFRQQLMRVQRPVRPPADHVGKSAATVNPEFPIPS